LRLLRGLLLQTLHESQEEEVFNMPEISLDRPALTLQDKERNKHLDAIVKLAEEHGISVEEVKRKYEETLELFQNATIKDYVPIFVSRCVKERLKDMHPTT
jgi:hypothetical protein